MALLGKARDLYRRANAAVREHPLPVIGGAATGGALGTGAAVAGALHDTESKMERTLWLYDEYRYLKEQGRVFRDGGEMPDTFEGFLKRLNQGGVIVPGDSEFIRR